MLPSVGQCCYLHWFGHALNRLSEGIKNDILSVTLVSLNIKIKTLKGWFSLYKTLTLFFIYILILIILILNLLDYFLSGHQSCQCSTPLLFSCNVVEVNNWITQVYPQHALCMSNPISHPPEGKPLFLTRA